MKKIGNVSKKTEFILHAGAALKSWFCDFLTSFMRQLKIPKIWIRALIVAIPKPGKALGDPKSYRPISLLWNDRSAVDQVTLLTQDIEDSFSAKKKAGALFVDLKTAYDRHCMALWPHLQAAAIAA